VPASAANPVPLVCRWVFESIRPEPALPIRAAPAAEKALDFAVTYQGKAGLWALGDAVYDYRHDLWQWTKDGVHWTGVGLEDAGKGVWTGTKWVGSELKNAGEGIIHAPSNIAHGIEHLANPLNW